MVVGGGSGGGATAAVGDVTTGAAVTANDDDAVGTVVPPSLTEDKDTCVGAPVVFEGGCIGAFVDGAGPLVNKDNVESAASKGDGSGSLAPRGTRTVAAPVDLHCC